MAASRLRAAVLGFALVAAGLFSIATAKAEHGPNPQAGRAVYELTCIAYHGADGAGTVPGAPDFQHIEGVLSKSDRVLLKNMTEGFQSPRSPLAIPPMGGNPDLTVDNLEDVLAYIRREFGS